MEASFFHPAIAVYAEKPLGAIMYLLWLVLAWVDFFAGIKSRVVAFGC
jgi:hypothetical protein